MNMFKKTGGFTLVELIVVIAILAILAGIAVPAYSGYIDSAKKAGDITALGAVKTACQAAMAKTGEVTSIKVEADVAENATDATVSRITVNDSIILYSTVDGGAEKVHKSDFDTYLAAVPTLSYFTEGAEWRGAEWDVIHECEDMLPADTVDSKCDICGAVVTAGE